ncbi:unnamed protein product, partial [Allacma fusca]
MNTTRHLQTWLSEKGCGGEIDGLVDLPNLATQICLRTIRMQYFIFAVPLEILAVAVWSITLVLKHIHVKRNIRSPSETIDFFLLSNLHLEIFLI